MDENTLAISALQHYAFCPRQFALIHVEQAWEENRFTAEGRLLHERVDSAENETRKKIRYERSVQINSARYGLYGVMDLLEIESGNPEKYFPVEYKRGKPKLEDWDRVQLCAQALCIEEMRGIKVETGAIWYWEVRRREPVNIDPALRAHTQQIIDAAKQVLSEGKTPPPTEKKKRCQACSLIELCQPKAFRQDWSAQYLEEIQA